MQVKYINIVAFAFAGDLVDPDSQDELDEPGGEYL